MIATDKCLSENFEATFEYIVTKKAQFSDNTADINCRSSNVVFVGDETWVRRFLM